MVVGSSTTTFQKFVAETDGERSFKIGQHYGQDVNHSHDPANQACPAWTHLFCCTESLYKEIIEFRLLLNLEHSTLSTS